MKPLPELLPHPVPLLAVGMAHDRLVRICVDVVREGDPVVAPGSQKVSMIQLQCNGAYILVSFVFALLDLVPALDEMQYDVQHDRTAQRHVHVVPRHPRRLDDTQPIANIVLDVLEV